MTGNMDAPQIRMKENPLEGAYLFHCRVRVLSGAAAGKETPVESIDDGVITVSSAFDGSNNGNTLEGLAVGDEIMQPVVDSYANGEKCVTEAAWDFEKTNDFSRTLELALEEDGRVANVSAAHTFDKPGIYFPVIKVKSNRYGDATDIFTQCKNLDRVRVIVK